MPHKPRCLRFFNFYLHKIIITWLRSQMIWAKCHITFTNISISYISLYNCHNKCHIQSCMAKVSYKLTKVTLSMARCQIAFMNISIYVYIYIYMYNSHTKYYMLSCMIKVSYNMTKCHVTYQCVITPFSIIISWCNVVWLKCHLIRRKCLFI